MQRQGGRARMGGQPDLHIVPALRAEGLRWRDRDGDLGVRHGQRGQLGGDLCGEPGRGDRSRRRELRRQIGDSRRELGLLGGKRPDPVLVAIQLGQPLPERPTSPRPAPPPGHRPADPSGVPAPYDRTSLVSSALRSCTTARRTGSASTD